MVARCYMNAPPRALCMAVVGPRAQCLGCWTERAVLVGAPRAKRLKSKSRARATAKQGNNTTPRRESMQRGATHAAARCGQARTVGAQRGAPARGKHERACRCATGSPPAGAGHEVPEGQNHAGCVNHGPASHLGALPFVGSTPGSQCKRPGEQQMQRTGRRYRRSPSVWSKPQHTGT